MSDAEEFLCPDCGTSLGFQVPGLPVPQVHQRCPVRTAHGLGMNRDDYPQVFQAISRVIGCTYLDVPGRSDLAAGAVLEYFSKCGYELKRRKGKSWH